MLGCQSGVLAFVYYNCSSLANAGWIAASARCSMRVSPRFLAYSRPEGITMHLMRSSLAMVWGPRVSKRLYCADCESMFASPNRRSIVTLAHVSSDQRALGATHVSRETCVHVSLLRRTESRGIISCPPGILLCHYNLIITLQLLSQRKVLDPCELLPEYAQLPLHCSSPLSLFVNHFNQLLHRPARQLHRR